MHSKGYLYDLFLLWIWLFVQFGTSVIWGCLFEFGTSVIWGLTIWIWYFYHLLNLSFARRICLLNLLFKSKHEFGIWIMCQICRKEILALFWIWYLILDDLLNLSFAWKFWMSFWIWYFDYLFNLLFLRNMSVIWIWYLIFFFGSYVTSDICKKNLVIWIWYLIFYLDMLIYHLNLLCFHIWIC
jgi:hypothetical protein